MPKRLIFLFFDGCEGLSFSGPQQAFHEANVLGADYEIHSCGYKPEVITEQGLHISGLEPLPEIESDDRVFISGLTLENYSPPEPLIRWIAESWKKRPTMISVCSGAFFLGLAGILDGHFCTTHWKRYAQLQERFPHAKVVQERLFVEDGKLCTSGGGASIIDLALHIIEQDYGPLLTVKAAREMVVFFRRDSDDRQISVYLDYRTHLHPGIHQLQDFLSKQPESDIGLDDLARKVGMSPRNLTRTFRQATGISVHEYRTKLRLERARGLLNNPGLTVEAVAERCGFADPRQFRRVWKQSFGTTPKELVRSQPV